MNNLHILKDIAIQSQKHSEAILILALHHEEAIIITEVSGSPCTRGNFSALVVTLIA
jgi:hypothetical protein